MARKQADYLASLLEDEPAPSPEGEGPLPPPAPSRIRAGTTLLGRESALARVASGAVRQVTQLMLDPARVRVWPGNARNYAQLTEAGCRELIDSIVAEGGQKVPAVVRRVEGDPNHDYEVIAGTRRHWSVSWLRAHDYPDTLFLAQVAALDDEAAFRLADLENRARADVSDLERARNYAAALDQHYGGHQTRMAERLRLSKGWLSKMIKVAGIPDTVIAALTSPTELKLKPAYPLAQALDNKSAAKIIEAEARLIAHEQAARAEAGDVPFPAADVLRRLMAAPADRAGRTPPPPYVHNSRYGRPALTVQSANRSGVTLRLHAGSGATTEEVVDAVRETLAYLEGQGRGLQR